MLISWSFFPLFSFSLACLLFSAGLSFFQRSDSCGSDEGNSSSGGSSSSASGRSDGHSGGGGADADLLLTPEEIEQCLYSLGDHNTYLRFNREPCDRMIGSVNSDVRPSRPGQTPTRVWRGIFLVLWFVFASSSRSPTLSLSSSLCPCMSISRPSVSTVAR